MFHRVASTQRPHSAKALRRPGCRGTSYLEVCMAIAILSLCTVPAMRALPMILKSQRNVQTRYLLSLVAQQKLEEAALDLQLSFSDSQEEGDLAASGHADWRYDVLVDVPVAGDGRYATVRARAWADDTANQAPDAGEPQVRFDTIVVNSQWSE